MKFETDIEALNQLGGRLGSQFGRHELNQLTQAASALGRLAESGTSEQHRVRVTSAAKGYQDSLKRARSSLGEREQHGLQALTEARQERLGLRTDKFILPIVTAFQNAPDRKTRLEYLEQAVQTGDGRTLAALIESPEFVTGIDRATLSSYLESAERKHAPDLADRREMFDSDREVIARALEVGERIAAQAVDLESIERAEQADAAEAELKAATG